MIEGAGGTNDDAATTPQSWRTSFPWDDVAGWWDGDGDGGATGSTGMKTPGKEGNPVGGIPSPSGQAKGKEATYLP